MSNELNYDIVIGLEIHAQLNTNSKLFSAAPNAFGQPPNTALMPLCVGLPGTLPVLNNAAVEKAIIAGIALNCEINPVSVFSRKNYFYPDLPKGYQISQYDQPICGKGFCDIDDQGTPIRIGITRIHLEEDAGKLVHQGADGIAGATHSIVDLNRAGAPLIEIVSEPDFRSARHAAIYMATIHELLVHIGVCNGNLEQGQLRCDANVSLRPVGSTSFGTRTEIKNLNSFRSVERAITIEVNRQRQLLDQGKSIVQCTLNYDEQQQTVTVLRTKENAHDYRYFPEPDLPPLVVSEQHIASLRDQQPELPSQKRTRYSTTLGLSKDAIKVLMSHIDIDRYFNACLNESADTSLSAKDIVNWIIGDVNALFKEHNISFESTSFLPCHLIAFITAIKSGKLTGKMAKSLLPDLVLGKTTLENAIQSSGGGVITDESELNTIVQQTLSDHPDVVKKIQGGKTQAIMFLVGQIMKQTSGRADVNQVKSFIETQIQHHS